MGLQILVASFLGTKSNVYLIIKSYLFYYVFSAVFAFPYWYLSHHTSVDHLRGHQIESSFPHPV